MTGSRCGLRASGVVKLVPQRSPVVVTGSRRCRSRSVLTAGISPQRSPVVVTGSSPRERGRQMVHLNASTEPGRGDREQAGPAAQPSGADRASTEPGRGDREQVEGPDMRLGETAAPQRSPVVVTGSSCHMAPSGVGAGLPQRSPVVVTGSRGADAPTVPVLDEPQRSPVVVTGSRRSPRPGRRG